MLSTLIVTKQLFHRTIATFVVFVVTHALNKYSASEENLVFISHESSSCFVFKVDLKV